MVEEDPWHCYLVFSSTSSELVVLGIMHFGLDVGADTGRYFLSARSSQS